MNNNDIPDYPPLKRVVDALYEDEQTLDQIKASLQKKGYDPSAIVARVKKTVAEGLRAGRVSQWQDEARAKLEKMKAASTKQPKWGSRPANEIERAFNDAMSGVFGVGPQMQMKAAFRNYQELSVSDKASLLDDLDVLSQMDEPPKDGQ